MGEIKWIEDTSYTQEELMKEVVEELNRRANERLKKNGVLFESELYEMFYDIVGIEPYHKLKRFERGYINLVEELEIKS